MKEKYKLQHEVQELPADTLTPVGIYLRLRDIYPGSLLLECTDYSSRTNAFSYICLNPILGIELKNDSLITYFPGGKEENTGTKDITEQVNSFLDSVEVTASAKANTGQHGLYGFTSFDCALLFEKHDPELVKKISINREVPFLKYDFYKVILSFNHFNETLSITEYYNSEIQLSETTKILSLLANHNFTSYPFSIAGEEEKMISDETYRNIVSESVRQCAIGNVFQIVVSRRYTRQFSGDEFNVYRSLRSVNPSPYLFYFDYIAYKIFGSSPEAQLKVDNGKATINPIAGTIRRTGDVRSDLKSAQDLLDNPKENSEHVMLVDLARNDLGRSCKNVQVEIYKEIQAFSHLLHLVSTVSGELNDDVTPFTVFARTFPAGTLSGAPKHKAIELITGMESAPRGYYGGAIGFIGLKGSLNQAIIIRSFFSKGGILNYQAGAGVVINSTPEGELREVNNKLDALRTALDKAKSYTNF